MCVCVCVSNTHLLCSIKTTQTLNTGLFLYLLCGFIKGSQIASESKSFHANIHLINPSWGLVVKAGPVTCWKVTNNIHLTIRKKKEKCIVIIHQLYIGQPGYVNMIMLLNLSFWTRMVTLIWHQSFLIKYHSLKWKKVESPGEREINDNPFKFDVEKEQ